MIDFNDFWTVELPLQQLLRLGWYLSLVSIFLMGCIPEPKIEYPTPAQEFAQEVTQVIPRTDTEPPPDTQDMGLLEDHNVMDLDMPETGLIGPNSPDFGPPVLRTRSIHFTSDPTQRISSKDSTVYGHFGLGNLIQQRAAE